MIENNCLHYEHQDGTPEPESRWSCRGCKHSFDPERYDPGCRHPNKFSPRDPAIRLNDELEESKRLSKLRLIKRLNEANRK